MRVLLISPSLPPAAEGEAEHGLQLARRLAARGHEVSIVTHRRFVHQSPPDLAPCLSMAGWRWRDMPRLASCLLASRPQGVVLVYTARLYADHPMMTFLPTLLRWCRPSARVVVLVEVEGPPPIGGRGVRALRKFMTILAGPTGLDYGYGSLLRDSHAVAALGPSILNHLRSQDPALGGRGVVIPPPPLVARPAGFDSAARAAARLRLGASGGTFVLAYFGFVYPRKGVETLLLAMAELVRAGRPVRLLMAGGGRFRAGAGAPVCTPYEAALQVRAEAMGLAEHVVWIEGYVGDPDRVAADLMAADAAVLPFDDGAELRRSSIAVVAELGLPLITTTPAQHEPAFVEGVNALLSPARDAGALCAAVCRLMDDAGLRTRLASGSSALARQWFSWETALTVIETHLAAPGSVARALG
jgi:glycosyltransferase involved in cell wall biosynthesis